MLLGANPAGHEIVLNAVRQGKIVVAWRGHIAVLDQGVVEVAIERLLHFGHILELGNAADTANGGRGNSCESVRTGSTQAQIQDNTIGTGLEGGGTFT